MIIVWGPGHIEYYFLWRYEITHAPGEQNASADSRLNHPLVKGELISIRGASKAFSVVWRYPDRFGDRSRTLHFLSQFQKDPLAMAALRQLSGQRISGADLSRLTNESVLAAVAGYLQEGSLALGYLPPPASGGSSADAKKEPAKREYQPALPPQPSSNEEEAEPTFLNSDGDAQAAALIAAAQSGIPFCEECAKAAKAAANG